MLNISVFRRIVIVGLVLVGLAFAMPNLFYPRVERHNDAVAAIDAAGGIATAEQEADAGAWPNWLPSTLVSLGLDLRGGAHLLAEVQVQDVYEARMESIWDEVFPVLRNARDVVGTIRRLPADTGTLRIQIGNTDHIADAAQLVRALGTPIVSLTGTGSTDIEVTTEGDVITVQLSEAERVAMDDRTMQQSVEIIRRRVDEVGTREPTIQRQGEDRILIQVPGLGSADELKALIGTTAQLTFHSVISRTSDADTRAGLGQILVPSLDEPGTYYLLDSNPVVSGDDLVDSQPTFNTNGQPAVDFRFNSHGARTFGDYTANNVGSPFAIVLDNEVLSAPVIREHIAGGSGIISGNFTVEEATNLAVLLRAGALPAEMTFLEERTIGPELGADSIEAGKLASAVAFVLVLVFMAAAYGWFGILANVALILNVAMMFGLLSAIGATLTLPGIAGIVLTIGMAVDANVLVFERIREELKAGRGPARSIELGYEKAMSAIVDANITTFLTAGILFFMGSGPVKGFAVTLALGIITSVFTALFVTRLLVVLWFERRRPKTLEV